MADLRPCQKRFYRHPRFAGSPGRQNRERGPQMHSAQIWDAKLLLSKAQIGIKNANFMGHAISPAGVRPNAADFAALADTSTPINLKQLCSSSLLGDISCFIKLLPGLSKRLCPTSAVLNQGIQFSFTPSMETIGPTFLPELIQLSVLVFVIGM